MEKKIRLGIIGIGNMGSGHADNITAGKCPDFKIVAVADINSERLQWARDRYGDCITYFSDAEDMLKSGMLDACIISVPHYDHPKYTIDCIKRGIHVMCEKPAGVYTKQVCEMNSVADENPQVVFGMMFNQRTSYIYRKMRELIQSGEYGQIRRTNWLITNWYRPQAYYNSGDWRATWSGEGGGVLLNQCPHQLDLWQWICGMPEKIEAHLHYGKWHDIEVEDDVTAYAEYKNGATGVFVTSTGDACGTNRFEVQTDKAKIVAENGRLIVNELEISEPQFTKTNTLPFGQPLVNKIEFEEVNKSKKPSGHVMVLNAWGGAILRGTPLVADGREGIKGLTISNAMHLSSWLKKEITLPFDENLYYNELEKRIKNSRRKANAKSVFADTSGTY